MSQSSMEPGKQLTTLEQPPTYTTPKSLEGKTLYEILGIPQDASPSLIKRVWRKLSKRHHPDAGGNPGVFEAIKRAYDVLKDPEARRTYDATGLIRDSEYWTRVAAKAKQQVADILGQAVDQEDDPDHSDVMAKLMKVMDSGPVSFANQEKEARRKMKKLENMRKRFRRKKGQDGEGFITALFDKQIEGAQKQLEAIQEGRDTHKKMVELLNEYIYDYDEKEEPEIDPSSQWRTVVFRSGPFGPRAG